MIEKVSEKNISDAAAVYMNSWKESHKNICSAEFIEKHDESYMREFLLCKIKSGYKIYISYKSGIPVGIVGINPTEEEICLLYVAPKEQGKGFGTELLEFAILKCKSPYITVLDTNTKAIDFYKNRGFVTSEKQQENAENKRIFERKYVYQNKNI